MQRAKGDSGIKLFNPSEYLTEQQITSFFSQEASQHNRYKDHGLDESDEEYLQATEEESALDNFRDNVHLKVSLHQPIVCDTVNVCHLVQSDTIQKLSLAKLKEMCAFWDIDKSDILTKGRKRPFIKKIKAFTVDCSCQSI